MTSAERLARLVYVLIWALVLAMAAVFARGLITGYWPLAGSVDPQTGTAAIAVATDAATGCQYILTPLGGIAPRTGRDGRQVCEAKP